MDDMAPLDGLLLHLWDPFAPEGIWIGGKTELIIGKKNKLYLKFYFLDNIIFNLQLR